MASILWHDLETYSEVDLRQYGGDNYSDASEIMLFSWAIDNGPVSCWRIAEGMPPPGELVAALRDPSVLLYAHNATFEEQNLRKRGFRLDPRRFRCMMAHALAHSLPGGLDKLCEIFAIPSDQAKIKDGQRLVQLFCKPQPKNRKLRRATHKTHPEEWERFVEYCNNDVEAMRAVHAKMPNWNYLGFELELWHLDQTINRRGFLVDMRLVNAAISTAERAKVVLAKRAKELTNGEVEATTQRDKLLRHLLETYNVIVDNLQSSTIEDVLEKMGDDLPAAVRELLENRLAASTTSVSKYKRLAKLVNRYDNRMRYSMQFCGAKRTGRWAGRGFQPQNLPRPTLKNDEINAGITAIIAGLADTLYPNCMELLQSAVRGAIIYTPGKKGVVSDLSNIEGRGLAYLAGERWKLEAFRQYDAGTGHDLYALAYANSFNVTPESVMHNAEEGDGTQRQIGKVMELALGYEGGVGAFVTFALVYGLDLDAMSAGAIDLLPRWAYVEAMKAWEWAREKHRTYGLSQTTYVVCDAFKRMWRAAHPETVAFWKELEHACRDAIALPGRVFICRKLRIVRQGTWLRIVLPSGRSLCYPGIHIDRDNKLAYFGENPFTRQWVVVKTYSGKLAENVTQAFARDVLAYNMPLAEAYGYEIVLDVHDELITEAPDAPTHDGNGLSAIMARNPHWAPDMPLASKGFAGYRYRKG